MPLVKRNKTHIKNLSKCQMTMSNDDYTTGNLLDYLYHQSYYKLIGIDLSRQTNTSIPQQSNFTGILEEDDGATMIIIAEK